MTPKEVSLLLWELHLFPFWHHDSQLRFAGPHRDRACWLIPFPLLSSSKLNLQALRYGSGCTNRSSRTIHHRLCQPISARARNVWAPLNTRLALSRTGTIRLRLVQQSSYDQAKRPWDAAVRMDPDGEAADNRRQRSAHPHIQGNLGAEAPVRARNGMKKRSQSLTSDLLWCHGFALIAQEPIAPRIISRQPMGQ
jgi:hypothetical protein